MKTIVFIPKISHNGHLIEDAVIVKEMVPVYLNFERTTTNRIGTAKLTKDEYGVVCAEFDVKQPIKGLYPAIGGVYIENNINITEIGVCGNPNTDERIEPIG